MPDKISDIEKRWQFAQHNPTDMDALETLYRLTHGLAGSGATFGFPKISEAAQRAEQSLLECIENGSFERTVCDVQISELLRTLEHAAAGSDRTDAVAGLSVAAPVAEQNKCIFIVDGDEKRAKALQTEIAQFGCDVTRFPNLNSIAERQKSENPAAIIVNADLKQDISNIVAGALSRDSFVSPRVPIIFTVPKATHEIRIAAVRAGGQGLLVRPFDTSKLIQLVDSLTNDKMEPYRVLIVEDDLDQATQYAAVLEGAGMSVTVISDPKTLFDDLANFDAELILMDLYLPDCTGLELASALRQKESETGVPIVFLSTEARIDRQLEAFRLGGDDFLTKPIAPDHLSGAVASRVRRARVVRSHMMRDSLSEALNHMALMDQLEREVSRAERNKTPLAFALLDLDRFKSINDVYGHGAGDRVIKSLSRILHKRLRRTDVIGRYGGEEFAIVFTGTDSTTAKRIVDDIRREFADQVFSQDGQEFSVTLSGGVANFDSGATAHDLRDTADHALYAAKDAGRNCIVDANNS